LLVRCHGGHGGTVAIPLRIGSTRGGTAEVLNMFKVSAVPPRRSAVLTVFRGATAINGGTTAIMAVPLRFMPYKHRNSTVVAPRLRCDGGIRPCRKAASSKMMSICLSVCMFVCLFPRTLKWARIRRNQRCHRCFYPSSEKLSSVKLKLEAGAYT